MKATTARVVWVEDDADLRILYSRILRVGGFQFEMASNAVDGLALYRKCLVQGEVVLVLDIAMPDHTGLWLARQVRAGGDWKTKIIFVTAHDRVMNRHGAEDVGAVAYLSKTSHDAEPSKIIDLLRETTAIHEVE